MSAIKSPLCWYGGKFRMRRKLIDRFQEHNIYIEPFCGAAWVLFGKEPAKLGDVINDRNIELINFWKTLRDFPEKLIHAIQEIPRTREYFEELKRFRSSDRFYAAANFYFQNRFSYSGVGQNWSNGKAQRASYDRPDILRKASTRLQGVDIHCYDWAMMLALDCEGAFFFLDPPYLQTKAKYNYLHAFETTDFEELSRELKTLKGKFLLTINDHPEIRELFKDFNCEEIEHYYSAHHGPVRKKVVELIYTNYEKEGSK